MKLQAKSDIDLLKLLSHQYRQMRGAPLASLSLRTLVNIKFVYFDAHKAVWSTLEKTIFRPQNMQIVNMNLCHRSHSPKLERDTW